MPDTNVTQLFSNLQQSGYDVEGHFGPNDNFTKVLNDVGGGRITKNFADLNLDMNNTDKL
jgi:hypothetical protein